MEGPDPAPRTNLDFGSRGLLYALHGRTAMAQHQADKVVQAVLQNALPGSMLEPLPRSQLTESTHKYPPRCEPCRVPLDTVPRGRAGVESRAQRCADWSFQENDCPAGPVEQRERAKRSFRRGQLGGGKRQSWCFAQRDGRANAAATPTSLRSLL
jgi:hypothetical protein